MSSQFAFACLANSSEGADLIAHPHYTDILQRATGHPTAACWLCGQPSDNSIPVGDQIGESFTNHSYAQAPRSDRLCAACVFFLMAHPESRHWWRNRSHLFTAAGVRHPLRNEWRGILLDPPAPPCMACLATSGQKNLIFRAPIAHTRDHYPVQFEEEVVIVDRARLAALLGPFEVLYSAGVTKEEIRTGRVNSTKVLAIGVDRYRQFDAVIAPHRGSLLLELVAWVAQKGEESE